MTTFTAAPVSNFVMPAAGNANFIRLVFQASDNDQPFGFLGKPGLPQDYVPQGLIIDTRGISKALEVQVTVGGVLPFEITAPAGTYASYIVPAFANPVITVAGLQASDELVIYTANFPLFPQQYGNPNVSINLSSPGPIGNTTPNTGAFTDLKADTLEVSGATSLSAASGPGGTPFALRNRLINGAFPIWQRGNNISTGITTNTYTADRWIVYATGAAVTVSQGAPNASGSSKYPSGMSIQGASGNTDVIIQQRIESVNCNDLIGADVTVSFVFQSNAAMDIGWQLAYPGNADNWSTESTFASGVLSYQTSGAVEVFSFTVKNLPSQVAFGLGLTLAPNNGAGLNANEYVSLTNVQLEAGDQQTPFETRPYGFELSLCHRYCYAPNGDAVGFAQTPSNIVVNVALPRMRTSPSVSFTTSNPYSESPWFISVASNTAATNNGTHPGLDAMAILVGGYAGLTQGVVSMIHSDLFLFTAEL